MIHFTRDLDIARDTITDLRRRLDEADQDRRHLTALLAERPIVPNVPLEIPEGVFLPPTIQDEIELVASNGAMARYLETWAHAELRKGTEHDTIIDQIRHGDEPILRVMGDE